MKNNNDFYLINDVRNSCQELLSEIATSILFRIKNELPLSANLNFFYAGNQYPGAKQNIFPL